MSQEPQPAEDNAGRKRPKNSDLVSLLIFPVIVVVLGAVLVTAFTPLGTSMRELLFQTRAAVAGSVTVDGKPAISVHLKLDGVDRGSTDADGRFVLTEVGKGQHRLHMELVGANPRDEMFSVAGGQTVLQISNVEMDPLVRLAYTPSVHLSEQQFDYDITLWIIGDPDVLNRIKSVSYTLPVPLSSRPVSGASASHAFCYRQTGSLSPLNSFGNSAPVLALASVDLGAGGKFQISAPASTKQPPDCRAHQAGAASAANTTPAQGQQPSSSQGQQQPSSPGQSGASPTSSSTPLPEVPDVVGLSQASAEAWLQSVGFKVNVQAVAGPTDTLPGSVWQQNPTANTTAALGSTVTILVQPAAVPPRSPTPTSSPSR